MNRQWTEEMGEISGFGGQYEEACRAMILAGIDWLDSHPTADPKYHGFKDVFGIVLEDNDDAKALSEAIVAPARDKGGATGAMHQAAVQNCLAYKRLGWDGYVRQRREGASAQLARKANKAP